MNVFLKSMRHYLKAVKRFVGEAPLEGSLAFLAVCFWFAIMAGYLISGMSW